MSEVKTVLKCRAEDTVLVTNYRSIYKPVELGVVTAVETQWDCFGKRGKQHRNRYDVTLNRRSASGNPITLTVGDDGIVKVVERGPA